MSPFQYLLQSLQDTLYLSTKTNFAKLENVKALYDVFFSNFATNSRHTAKIPKICNFYNHYLYIYILSYNMNIAVTYMLRRKGLNFCNFRCLTRSTSGARQPSPVGQYKICKLWESRKFTQNFKLPWEK